MLDAGDPQAEEPLHAALAAYQDLNATWDWNCVVRLARTHGIDVARTWHGGRRGYGDQLSPREREVAELTAEGRTNQQIAQQLFISPKTVEAHLSSIRRKLEVRSRAAIGRRLAET